MSIMVRQSRRVFVQERAERIISKPKPKMHPFYPTEEKIMKQIKAEHPELEEKVVERLPDLEERVGTIRISSHELPQIQGEKPKAIEESGLAKKEARHLPEDRFAHPDSEFGFYEPPAEKVPRGRILFSKAMELLRLREESREQAQQFAKQFAISENNTKAILDYFAPFTNAVALLDEKKPDIDDPSQRVPTGRRAILQKRIVSELEQLRIEARMSKEISASSDEIKKLEEEKKGQT